MSAIIFAVSRLYALVLITTGHEISYKSCKLICNGVETPMKTRPKIKIPATTTTTIRTTTTQKAIVLPSHVSKMEQGNNTDVAPCGLERNSTHPDAGNTSLCPPQPVDITAALIQDVMAAKKRKDKQVIVTKPSRKGVGTSQIGKSHGVLPTRRPSTTKKPRKSATKKSARPSQKPKTAKRRGSQERRSHSRGGSSRKGRSRGISTRNGRRKPSQSRIRRAAQKCQLTCVVAVQNPLTCYECEDNDKCKNMVSKDQSGICKPFEACWNLHIMSTYKNGSSGHKYIRKCMSSVSNSYGLLCSENSYESCIGNHNQVVCAKCCSSNYCNSDVLRLTKNDGPITQIGKLQIIMALLLVTVIKLCF